MAAARAAEAPAQASPAQACQAPTNAPPAKADETATNAPPAKAGQTPAALTPEQMFEGEAAYKNWVEFSTGGFIVRGDAGQAEQREQLKRGAFGGIQDLHVEGNLDKKTTVTVDGHSIFDDHDYQLNLALKREDTGYVRVGFENFRTWSDSAGGFFGPDNLQFSQAGEGLGLERGQVFLEAGLNLKNAPKVTFRYTHRYRQGDESSTLWGPVNTSQGTRNIFPGSYGLDETFDTFELDVTHRIKIVDFGAGIRYEKASMNDGLFTTSQPGAAFQQRITDRQGTDYDMFSVHAFAESWLKKDLLLSAGFLYDNVDNTFSGNNIYGDDFNLAFAPNALSGLGYFDLHGGSRLHDYVFNLNALALPTSHFTIVPSVRVEKMDSDADAAGTGTLGAFPTEPFSARGDQDELDVTERVDFRYTGVTNWVFYAGPELTEGRGNLKENGGLSQVAGIGVPPIQLSTDESRLFQKYFAGVRRYPTRRLSLDAGGYYKSHEYDYNNIVDSTPNTTNSLNRYPGYLVLQSFDTYDGNVRATWRPVQNVTLVGRYEYQLSYVHTGPDPVLRAERDRVRHDDQPHHRPQRRVGALEPVEPPARVGLCAERHTDPDLGLHRCRPQGPKRLLDPQLQHRHRPGRQDRSESGLLLLSTGQFRG